MSQSGQFTIDFGTSLMGAYKVEGSVLSVSFPNARAIFGGIWRKGDNGPVIIFGQMQGAASVKLKRSSFSIKGPSILKVRAYLQDWTSQYLEAPFTIT